MITKQMLKDVGVSQETIDLLGAYPTAFRQIKTQGTEKGAEVFREQLKRCCKENND